MGNAATCSLVDVVGTVTVTQADGLVAEFVQPVFAWQVKKLHPGNWLVHYISVPDPDLGQHSKMSMLQGAEELQAGEIYFLLRIPSHFRKQVFGSSKQRSSSSKEFRAAAAESGGLPIFKPLGQHPQLPFRLDGSPIIRSLRQQSSPVFSFNGSGSSSPQPRLHRRCSSRHKSQVFDWQPTLMTIQEVF